MSLNEMIDVLRATFDDRRLSRGERGALKSVLVDVQLSRSDRAQLRHHAFEIASEEFERSEARESADWLYEVVKALDDVDDSADGGRASSRALFSPGDACGDQIRTQLKSARSHIEVCVFTITDDTITREIIAAAKRGVAVRVVTDDDKAGDLGSDAARLERAGVPVAYDRTGHMHHKFAVFDRRVVINGSYNWTRSAARDNSENIVLTGDRDLVRYFGEEFERLWDRYS